MLLSGAMVEFQAPKEGEGAVKQHNVAVRHRCLAIFCAKISMARKSNRCVRVAVLHTSVLSKQARTVESYE